MKITARRVWVGVGISMILVLLLGLLALRTTRRVADHGVRIADLHSVVGAAEALRGEVERAESAHRAFILTGEHGFRTAGLQAEAQARRQRDLLVTLLSASREQETLLQELDFLLDTRFTLIHLVAATFEQQGLQSAVAVLRSGAGVEAMDTLRIHLASMTDRHARLLVQQLHEQERGTQVTRVALVLSVVLMLLLLLIAGLIIARDVRLQQETAARREATEETLRQAILAAGQANRAKADFLARVSHEMRTPLNAILGMAELLRDSSLNPEQAEYARTIQTSGEDLLDVVSDLLDSSKMEAGQMELETISFSPRDVLESVAEVVAVRAEAKNLELALAISPYLPAQLRGDPTRFRQLLMNLLGNAVKFTDHGQVSVRADVAAQDGDRVQLRVEVADTGIGIAEENLHRIFLPFVQADSSTRRRFGGTGLGLNIAQSLAHSMGGQIEVESELGRGSTFRLTVRLTAASARPELTGTELQGHAVLLLIENRMRLDAVERLLSAAGATTVVARTLADAQARLGRQPLQAAVIEARAPGVGALLRGARTPLHALPVVLLTRLVENDPGTPSHWPAGLEQVLTPIRQKRLLEALHRAIRPRDPVPRHEETPPVGVTRGARVPPRILLAEDSTENRALVLNFLKAEGYRIDIADSGRDAIERARQFRYDLILMDIDMPGVDGLDATRAIRALEQAEGRLATPVVALTAHAVDGYRDRCLDAGMDEFATKPIGGETLRRLVARMVDDQPVVLVVEDAPDSQLVVRSFLRSEPYRLIFANDGATALRLLSAQRVSAVLLDMSLPDIDGYTVVADIRARSEHRDLPVIAVTGHTGPEEEARCLAAGCTAYLPKPLRRPALLRALAAVTSEADAPPSSPAQRQVPARAPLSALRESVARVRRSVARRNFEAACVDAVAVREAASDARFARLQRSSAQLENALREGDERAADFWGDRVAAELGELERLEALRQSGLLDSPRDEAFDSIARRVAANLNVPVALVSLVSEDRQFFKSAIGLAEPWATLRQTPLSHSFCQYVVSSRRPLAIADAREHPVVRDNMAIPDLGVIAYAGVPLLAVDGHVLGSLCAIDTRPRSWSEADIALLQDLAIVVEREIEREMRARQQTADINGIDDESGDDADPLLATFRERFLETRRKEVLQVAEWLEQGRLDDVARVGHQLKGTAATFGFPEVGAVGAKLEKAARSGDNEGARARLSELDSLLRQLG
jgi:signal transduction histidine kinase/CheY-like chemotaxis protein/HPt (histidine-containing phosphotransfer) domain-containing protein